MRPLPLAAVALLATICTPCSLLAITVRVPLEQPTIQLGIDAASAGDTVLVTCGTYYEHDIAMKSDVCLTSETGEASCVTVDAQQQGRVVYCDNVNDLASLVGLTMTGGRVETPGVGTDDGGGMYCTYSSPEIRNCIFTGNWAGASYGEGGGVCCADYSSPTLIDCAFSANTGGWQGGGLSCSDFSSPTLTGCEFSGNNVIDNLGDGAGMHCSYNTSPTLTGCTFTGNWTTDSGYSSGGGLYTQTYDSVTLTDCTFSENRAGGRGGGAYFWSGDVVMTGCTFSDNRLTGDSGHGGGVYLRNSDAVVTGCLFLDNEAQTRGGGLFCNDASPTLTSCVFVGNQAIASSGEGGAVYCFWNSFPTFTGCTFTGNDAAHLGGVLFCWESIPTLSNCIVAFNQSRQFAIHCLTEELAASTPVLSCCNLYGNDNGDWVGCIADQYDIDGNFSADPLFCDVSTDDVSLCSNSPCLPDGNDCEFLIGALDSECQDCSNPVERTSWGAVKAMYR